MFVDMVGSLALSHCLDPEVFGELIRDYRIVVSEAVDRFGGQVARYIGDGLLIYFGYPVAHENDPLRAVHAALDIVRVLNERGDDFTRRFGAPVRTRIGIHT
ncbi:MAG TPA: adenylate/guanylate cyclase domain-containing protein, partial [Microvirga sp.]|nr:adenylate/guanylate cyclase domain-containing protein [Microvirga sp.]